MELIVFESEAYYNLLAEQKKLIMQAIKEANQNSSGSLNSMEWVTLKEAQQILPYRSRTKWQELRDKGEIVFSHFGRKILYNKNSLLEYIKNNKVKSY